MRLKARQDGETIVHDAVLGDVRWVHQWGRATNTLRLSKAHRYELRSARTFYGMYPEFVFGLPRPGRRNAMARAQCGTSVPSA